MDCDLLATEIKCKQLFNQTLKKEISLDDICNQIKNCQTPYEKTWLTLQKSFNNICCTPIKGVLGKQNVKNDSYYYVQVPIFEDIADIVIDVLSSSLLQLSTKYVMKPSIRNHNLRLHAFVPKSDIIYKLDESITVDVVLQNIERQDGKFYIICLINDPEKRILDLQSKIHIASITSK